MANEESRKYEERILKAGAFSKERTQKLPYHNFRHEREVLRAAENLAQMIHLDYVQSALVRTAAILHDVIVVPGRKDNEEKSVELIQVPLLEIGYSQSDVNVIGSLIMATKMPQQPKNLLECIICDADLDSLGRPDFLYWGEKLRSELGIPKNRSWYEAQLIFIDNHSYHTKAARKLRDNGKRKNIEKLKKILEKI